MDQEMAATAAAMLPGEVSKELRTRYRQLRGMLHSAGLAATYAFIAAKAAGEDAALARAYSEVARGLRQRLAQRGLLVGDAASMSAVDVLTQLGCAPTVDYLRASAEASALVGWLSRLADACWQQSRHQGDEADTSRVKREAAAT